MKNILFLCVGNSCRSQMAEGFAKNYMKGVNVYSAGSKPEGYIHPLAIEAMREIGIDISEQVSKGIDELPKVAWDAVIVVCSSDACPYVPGRYHEVWSVPDPVGKDLNFYRKVRDEIICLIKRLNRILT